MVLGYFASLGHTLRPPTKIACSSSLLDGAQSTVIWSENVEGKTHAHSIRRFLN